MTKSEFKQRYFIESQLSYTDNGSVFWAIVDSETYNHLSTHTTKKQADEKYMEIIGKLQE